MENSKAFIDVSLLKEVTGSSITYKRDLVEEYGKVDKNIFKINSNDFGVVIHGNKVYTLVYMSQSSGYSEAKIIGTYTSLEVAKRYMAKAITENSAYTEDNYYLEKCGCTNVNEILCYQFTDGGNDNFEIYTITETNIIIE